jgi:hypothetical protein
MKTADCLRKHRARTEYTKWALSISADMSAVWDAMIEQGKHDWLIWTATRPGVFPASVIHKLLCRFVRETPLSDGRKVWDLLTDERSRKAVEVAEAYADGKATTDELAAATAAARAVARAAADAADAAYSAAADAYAAYSAAADAYADANAADAAAWAAYADACAAANAAWAALAVAHDAANAAAWVAGAVVYDAARDAAWASAKSAQIKMIAALGNPFK